MSKTGLQDALAAFDLDRVREVVRAEPKLRGFKQDAQSGTGKLSVSAPGGAHPT
jgi:hypothetical protein